jgi:hypothetical protein
MWAEPRFARREARQRGSAKGEKEGAHGGILDVSALA